MNYKQTATSGIGYGEVHTTNEWYHLIRAKQTGDNKQWKNVVKIFKAAVASGELAMTKEKSTGAVAGATGRKAKATAGNATKTATQKAPRSTVKKVSYQVSDPNDNRHWEFKKEQFDTEASRDEKIKAILANPDQCYVSKGWGDKKYSVAYWEVKK